MNFFLIQNNFGVVFFPEKIGRGESLFFSKFVLFVCFPDFFLEGGSLIFFYLSVFQEIGGKEGAFFSDFF